mmetsp:Transcript_48999/g.127904  ORF Transcript_48999/g.127904 Transcript_48999/m.127904 type:complete len:518 (-) Transcript_48999:512-2065(-)
MQAAMLDVLCGDVMTATIANGMVWVITIAVSLFVIAIPRNKFARQVDQLMSSTNPLAFIAPDVDKFRHSFQIKLPKCGVVMPVKGVHDQSYANWRAQITSMYGGGLEFFFCVESADDPAYPHVQRLIAENPEFEISLLVAGVSWHCSQKIHNQLYGFERAMRSCEYVIVIDDDIKLHPGTIRAWVEEMESDPQALAASGYAFEYVAPGEFGWASFFAMLWRLNASSGFNSAYDRPPNCWGGAMMFRASELRANVYGLMDAWRDGGYSEDFITLSMARYHRRTLAVPKSAMFPNQVGGVKFDRFWNFLCRQIYVLTQTYATEAQRTIAIPCYVMNGTAHACIAVGGVCAALVSLSLVLSTAATAVLGADASGAAIAHSLTAGGQCTLTAGASLGFWMSLLVFGATGTYTLRCFAGLCNVLSPHGFGGQPIDVRHISPVRLGVAYLLYSPLIPAATLATLFNSAIVWSGVRFHVARGKVSAMYRKDSLGAWYTVPPTESMETAFKELAAFQLSQDGVLQ